MPDAERTEVLVVGAGPAGLATAAALGSRGISYRLVERGPTLGSAWRNAYDSLTLHTGRHMSALPGMRFPSGTPLFPSKDQFWDYLQRYTKHFGITVETGREVKQLALVLGGWLAETNSGPITARNIVMATGIMSNPIIPALPGRERFVGDVLHSVEYRRPAGFQGKRVLVIGVGNSGGEIAAELGHAGVNTTVAVRSGANVVPREIAGVPIQYIAYWLRKLPDKMRAQIATRVQEMTEKKRGPAVLPRARTSPLDAVPLIGFHLVDAIRGGLVRAKLAAVSGFTERGVQFADGTTEEYDVVILATGFAAALDPLGDLVRRDQKGFAVRSDRVKSADQPALFFVGQNYDSTGGLRNISVDSVIVAERLLTIRRQGHRPK